MDQNQAEKLIIGTWRIEIRSLQNGHPKLSFKGDSWEFKTSDAREHKSGKYSITQQGNTLYLSGIVAENHLEGEIILCAINEGYMLLRSDTEFCILSRIS